MSLLIWRLMMIWPGLVAFSYPFRAPRSTHTARRTTQRHRPPRTMHCPCRRCHPPPYLPAVLVALLRLRPERNQRRRVAGAHDEARDRDLGLLVDGGGRLSVVDW